MIKAFIFDLDGVIVDTAIQHFRAWRRLADTMGFEFTEHDNERLKGVSRMRSLDIVLEVGAKTATHEQKEAMAKQKNEWYLEQIEQMTPNDILPGAKQFVESVKSKGYKTAIGSASKNTLTILDKVGIRNLFDVVIDGNKVSQAKPNPEVFLVAATVLGVISRECVVFEDAVAGIEAAKAANMYCVGIGNSLVLGNADRVVGSLAQITVDELLRQSK